MEQGKGKGWKAAEDMLLGLEAHGRNTTGAPCRTIYHTYGLPPIQHHWPCLIATQAASRASTAAQRAELERCQRAARGAPVRARSAQPQQQQCVGCQGCEPWSPLWQ